MSVCQGQTATSVQEVIVIEVLTGFPDYVAAYRFRKNLTKADLETVLIPLIEDKLSLDTPIL